MPQRSKGARLWLRPAWGEEKPVWIIRDGRERRSTGFGPGDRREAEKQLAAYLAEKHAPSRERGRDPAEILVADALSVYAADRGPSIRNPAELGQRMSALLAFFGTTRLGDVTAALCRSYAAQRTSDSMARRELEDLRAAIRFLWKEGLTTRPVSIWLPDKPEPRERWLTRSEAARLIWAAWRWRETQKGVLTDRKSRQHIARFVLVGLYTGTRSSAICGAALTDAVGRGFVDLERGVFYRRAKGAKKTKKQQPPVLIPDRLLAHLRRWSALGISRAAVVEFNGAPVKSVRKAFGRAAVDAGLPDVTPHVLRHTAASWAMQSGADPYRAADFLGMTVETLERVYGHLHPASHKDVGDAITGRAVSGHFNRNKRR
jgi:integrase